MTAKNLFLYQTILNLSFGIGLLFVPQMMINMYGVQKVDISGSFDIVARGYGTALIGFGITAYLMRNAKASLARYAFLVATCVAGGLLTILHIRAILRGDENSLGWLIVLLLVIVTAWSGMLLSKEKTDVLE